MTSARAYIHPYTNNRIIGQYPHGGIPLETVKARRKAGRKVCKWCGGTPQGMKRFWCSATCVFEWSIRSNMQTARQHVFIRDAGVCAVCSSEGNTEPHDKWENDHIIPVAEGGGECGLENFQTLCIPHHKIATSQSRARRERAKMLKAGHVGLFDVIPEDLPAIVTPSKLF